MTQIARLTGNFGAFASLAAAGNRTIFDDTATGDTLDLNMTASFLAGFALTGSEFPAMEDFNALGFTLGQALSYLHQVGVPEWDSAQEYYEENITKAGGVLYSAIVDTTGDDPTSSPTKWKLLVPSATEASLVVNDTTPTVSNGVNFKTANTSSTTITTFDDGVEGQRIKIRVDDAFSIIDGGLTKTGMTIPLEVDDELEFVYNGSSWKQTGGNVGMGQFVPFDEPVAVTDWILSSDTVYDTVDVSGIVRKGAQRVELQLECERSGLNLSSLRMKRNGGTNETSRWRLGSEFLIVNAFAMLDDDAIFQAYWSDDWSATEVLNDASAVGYYI